MAMSQKNYAAIADAVKTELEFVSSHETLTPSESESAYRSVARVAQRMADVFKSDNPRFRFDIFFDACGLDEWGD